MAEASAATAELTTKMEETKLTDALVCLEEIEILNTVPSRAKGTKSSSGLMFSSISELMGGVVQVPDGGEAQPSKKPNSKDLKAAKKAERVSPCLVNPFDPLHCQCCHSHHSYYITSLTDCKLP
jgi:hypothetical protein